MDAEKKQTEQREEMLKSISSLLDETIAEIEGLSKGDVSFKELKLQPDENGEMAGKAGQSGSDAMKPLKKEDEESESEEIAKEIPAELSESKDKKKEDKKDEDEDEDEEDEEEEYSKKSEEPVDAEYEKFKGLLKKALVELGFAEESAEELATKSEETEETEGLEKSEETSEEDGEELAKALEARDNEIKSLNEKIVGLTETVEKISRMPQGRKSLSGLQPIRKSEEDAGSDGVEKQSLNKVEILDKLLDAQRGGDKRVTSQLITKYELSGNDELVRDIIQGK